jgi:hypothetical protein
MNGIKVAGLCMCMESANVGQNEKENVEGSGCRRNHAEQIYRAVNNMLSFKTV